MLTENPRYRILRELGQQYAGIAALPISRRKRPCGSG